jgi:hypothetical protein
MPNRLVRVFRHQFLELGLSLFVFEMSGAGAGKNSCKFGPGITRAAAMRGFGGSTPKSVGGSPLSTQRQNLRSAVMTKCW